jgi:hypothetical protein
MELAGTIKEIKGIENGNNGFQKREIILTTKEQYPQHIKFDFINDKCILLDNFKVGQEVTIGFNIRGNEYNSKYYVNLQGWKIN